MHKILIAIMLVNLTGCAGYNSSFECKPGTGINCTSISKINKIVDRGGLDEEVEQQDRKLKKEIIKVKKKMPFPAVLPSNFDPIAVERAPETTLKIWVAPYVSANDGYIDDQYIYEVLEPGAWLDPRGV